MSKSKKPFFTSENLHQRFTQAKITENPKVGFIQAHVTDPDIPIKDLRISSQLDNPHRSDIDWKHYKKGDYIDVFIRHETGRESGFADAGKMANLKNNPWSKKSLHRGDTVEGIVSSYFDNADGVYAVLVTLEKNLTTEESWLYQKKKASDEQLKMVQFDAITAFLHKNETPLAPDQLLHKHLHIGDRVRAIIVDLDEDKLNITIDVNEYLTLRTERLQQKSEEAQISGTSKTQQQTNQEDQEDQEDQEKYRLLLIDDDEESSKTYQNNVHGNSPDKVRYITIDNETTVETLKIELENAADNYNAILCDFTFDNLNTQNVVHELLYQSQQVSNTNIRIAIVSSDHQTVHNWQYFSKPIQHTHIRHWLRTGVNLTPEKKYHEQHTTIFESYSTQGLATIAFERAEKLLKHCCDKTNATAAIWITIPRTNFYEFRASYNVNRNLLKSSLSHQLQHTIVKGCVDQESSMQVQKNNSAALKVLFPPNTYSAWAMPVKINGEYNRVILFFSYEYLSPKDQAYLKDKQNHIRDLSTLLETRQMLEESITFNNLGLQAASQKHEVSAECTALDYHLTSMLRYLDRPWFNKDRSTLRSELKAYVDNLLNVNKKLLDRIEFNLDALRDNEEPYSLSTFLKEICTSFDRRNATEKVRTRIKLSSDIDDATLTFPRRILEIALTNILNNAWHHGRGNPILVHASYFPKEEKPLRIRITDHGYGMTLKQQSTLPNPRVSTRDKGHGLGVFLSMTLLENQQAKLKLLHTIRWVETCFEIQLPVNEQEVTYGK